MQCWGQNTDGQLGDGTKINRPTPVAVAGLSGKVTSLALGDGHTCALLQTGQIQCWGSNGGALGDGTSTDRLAPVTVTALGGNATSISAGMAHTCALLQSGQVRCWGANGHGQLGAGTGNYISLYSPSTVVGLPAKATGVSAGGVHTCALLQTGAVYCWGHNQNAQLGNGTVNPPNRDTPVAVLGLTGKAASIGAGWWHTCALLQSGQVQCWGDNLIGPLGAPTTETCLGSPNSCSTRAIAVTGLVGEKVLSIHTHGQASSTCIRTLTGTSSAGEPTSRASSATAPSRPDGTRSRGRPRVERGRRVTAAEGSVLVHQEISAGVRSPVT